jgi:hypothetical protein
MTLAARPVYPRYLPTLCIARVGSPGPRADIGSVRDCLEVLGVDIHQNELGLDPALLGELRIRHGD